MKKFFLIFLLPLFFSCVDEDAQSTETKKESNFSTKSETLTIESTFRNLYYSSTYSELDKKMEDFQTKMNYDGDSSIFENETKVLNWISTNINSTTFTSYEEAKSEWASIETQGENIVQENTAFFQLIENSSSEEIREGIGQVLIPEIGDDENEALNKCKEEFKACRAEALKIFDMEYYDPSGSIPDWVGTLGASLIFAADMVKCRGAYNDCKGSIW